MTYTFARDWSPGCFYIDMSIGTILFVIQIVVTLGIIIRQSGKDSRFADEKMGFRS